MTIAVSGTDEQCTEITKEETGINWVRVSAGKENTFTDADAYFILEYDGKENFASISKPVFINSVPVTLKAMNLPENVLRINGWNGFLARTNWEVAGIVNETIEKIFTALQKKITVVPDEPGFISARVIAMIINEAYFALQEQVSTKEEIDIAMKLGTNYPLGPFEWAQKIGIRHIFSLLEKLSHTDKRYLPAGLLKQEAFS